jgi:hypothetical protein
MELCMGWMTWRGRAHQAGRGVDGKGMDGVGGGLCRLMFAEGVGRM